jgi:acylphosphatase
LNVRARNLDDGRVEVIARGAPQALDALCHWLQTGPRFARVAAVRCEALDEVRWPSLDGN